MKLLLNLKWIIFTRVLGVGVSCGAMVLLPEVSRAYDLSQIESVLSQRACRADLQEFYIGQSIKEACPDDGPNVDYFQVDKCQKEYIKAEKRVDEYNSFVRSCKKLFNGGDISRLPSGGSGAAGKNNGTTDPGGAGGTEGQDAAGDVLGSMLKNAKQRAGKNDSHARANEEYFDYVIGESSSARVKRELDEQQAELKRLQEEQIRQQQQIQNQLNQQGQASGEFDLSLCAYPLVRFTDSNVNRCYVNELSGHNACWGKTTINGQSYVYCGSVKSGCPIGDFEGEYPGGRDCWGY